MKSRDTRVHFSHAQTVLKRHTHANNYFVILRGSSYTLKKAVMPKRRSFYTDTNHKNYNFLACDWFKNVLFSTNSLAKLLSDSLLLGSLLLDSLLSDR